MRRRLVRPTTVAAIGVLTVASATACTAGSAGPLSSATTSGRASGTTPGSATAPATALGAARRRRRLRPLDPRPDPAVRPQRSDADARPLPDTDELDPADPTKVVPGMAEYTLSPRGPVAHAAPAQGAASSPTARRSTTDDVLFTLERAQGLSGPAASILGAVRWSRSTTAPSALTSAGSNFALPAILANPAFGILNATAVKAHGGTIGPGDTASAYLSAALGGFGSLRHRERPRHHRGAARKPTRCGRVPKPAFPEIIVRNLDARHSSPSIGSGGADLVLDLAARPPRSAPAGGLADRAGLADCADVGDRARLGRQGHDDAVELARLPRPRARRALNPWTADPRLRRCGASRHRPGGARAEPPHPGPSRGGSHPRAGIVGALEDLAPKPAPTGDPDGTGGTDGTGSRRPPRRRRRPQRPPARPPRAPRRLPTDASTTGADGIAHASRDAALVAARDLAAAKAALRRSGYRGQPVPLSYAADLPIQGIPASALAVAVRPSSAQVGIKVQLNPAPAAQAIAAYRAGAAAFSLWSWSPDYPDPENYLAFAPGELVGSRAGWARGTDPLVDDLTERALVRG